VKQKGLTSGHPAPEFSLPDQSGRLHSLKDYAGSRLLLYFYPKASTPGCTAQACSLRDSSGELADLGVTIAGISPDKPEALTKFSEKYSLNFVLLADPDKTVAAAYQVLAEKNMFGKKTFGIVRSSFLIDEHGIIIDAWYKIKAEQTALLAIESLKSRR
jgi:peroxiredoxin Q/BCP